MNREEVQNGFEVQAGCREVLSVCGRGGQVRRRRREEVVVEEEEEEEEEAERS
jgi:hypothetical protein